MFQSSISISTLAAALTLSACSSGVDNSAAIVTTLKHEAAANLAGGVNRSPPAISLSNIPATTKSLLATAAPFKVLSKAAFSATKAERDQAIEAASDALEQIQHRVPQRVAVVLDRNMAAIGAADVAASPADIALASIENYRILLSAIPGSPVVLVEVRLLDYAGFRFSADARAKPARWDDMARAVSFAHQRWLSIASNAAVVKVAPRFVTSLSAMEQSVREKSTTHARQAANAELDLVDDLEAAFAHTDHSKA